jgi:hypothetical protein
MTPIPIPRDPVFYRPDFFPNLVYLLHTYATLSRSQTPQRCISQEGPNDGAEEPTCRAPRGGNFQSDSTAFGAVSSTSARVYLQSPQCACASSSPRLSFANRERQAAQSTEHEGRSRQGRQAFLLTSAACLFYSPGGLMIQYETQCAAYIRRTQPQFHCLMPCQQQSCRPAPATAGVSATARGETDQARDDEASGQPGKRSSIRTPGWILW